MASQEKVQYLLQDVSQTKTNVSKTILDNKPMQFLNVFEQANTIAHRDASDTL
jgi:hypothetical protein